MAVRKTLLERRDCSQVGKHLLNAEWRVDKPDTGERGSGPQALRFLSPEPKHPMHSGLCKSLSISEFRYHSCEKSRKKILCGFEGGSLIHMKYIRLIFLVAAE